MTKEGRRSRWRKTRCPAKMGEEREADHKRSCAQSSVCILAHICGYMHARLSAAYACDFVAARKHTLASMSQRCAFR